jgi:hypothetical protein
MKLLMILQKFESSALIEGGNSKNKTIKKNKIHNR